MCLQPQRMRIYTRGRRVCFLGGGGPRQKDSQIASVLIPHARICTRQYRVCLQQHVDKNVEKIHGVFLSLSRVTHAKSGSCAIDIGPDTNDIRLIKKSDKRDERYRRIL